MGTSPVCKSIHGLAMLIVMQSFWSYIVFPSQSFRSIISRNGHTPSHSQNGYGKWIQTQLGTVLATYIISTELSPAIPVPNGEVDFVYDILNRRKLPSNRLFKRGVVKRRNCVRYGTGLSKWPTWSVSRVLGPYFQLFPLWGGHQKTPVNKPFEGAEHFHLKPSLKSH